MYVPSLPHWTGERVVLIGDAAHGLSPHLAADGTLGIEDVGVLRVALETGPTLTAALTRYEQARIPRFDQAREFAAKIENAADAAEFARQYVAFSHWMLTTAPES